MAISSGTTSDIKLLGYFLLPSWLSTLISVLVGVAIIGGTIVLTHVGSVVQQSLLGLNSAFRQSSLDATVGAVGGKFTHNVILGNIVFFLSWGLVGLVVYSIAGGIVGEFQHADELSHELNYVHTDRRAFIRNIGERAAIRIGALGAFLLAGHFFLYKIVPYGIATAHAGALHLTSMGDWFHSLVVGAVCAMSTHILIVLLRLIFLRVRFFGSEMAL